MDIVAYKKGYQNVQKNDQAKEARVFAHDAVNLTPAGVLDTTTIDNTNSRGVCLYVGQGMDITVTMESGTASITFKSVSAGSFLPILVTAVTAYTLTDGTATKADNDILALY